MKKRNCRKTDTEREQHDRAIRIRKMTDAQLCEYLDSLAKPAPAPQPAGPTPAEIISNFLDALSIRTDDGLRVSDATIRKLREIARQRGFIPPLPPIGPDSF